MHSIASWLDRAVPGLGDMRKFLEGQRSHLEDLKVEFPDGAEKFDAGIASIDAKLAVLDSVADTDNLKMLAVTVYNELSALPKEGLRPSQSPVNTGG